MSQSLLFLFQAISAACALAAFFRIDVVTVAKLFGNATSDGTRSAYTPREVIIAILIFTSLCLGGVGFFLSKADNIPRLSDNQKRTLLK